MQGETETVTPTSKVILTDGACVRTTELELEIQGSCYGESDGTIRCTDVAIQKQNDRG